MPAGVRWWAKRTRAYVRLNETAWSEEHTQGIRMALRRYQAGRDRQRHKTPGIWERVGVRPAPTRAADVTAAMVMRVKRSTIWAPKTRELLPPGAAGLPSLRRSPAGRGSKALGHERLRWAPPMADDVEQLVQVWAACRDEDDRLLVAAGGMNGFRRAEVRRLRGRDVSLDLAGSEARLEGKTGPRTVRVGMYLRNALVALDRHGAELFFPWKNTEYDSRLKAIGRRAGLASNPSAHVLRRSFGRLAYRAAVPLVDIQRIYGHASPAMTVYYIGIESDQMAAGLATFERSMPPPTFAPEAR